MTTDVMTMTMDELDKLTGSSVVHRKVNDMRVGDQIVIKTTRAGVATKTVTVTEVNWSLRGEWAKVKTNDKSTAIWECGGFFPSI